MRILKTVLLCLSVVLLVATLVAGGMIVASLYESVRDLAGSLMDMEVDFTDEKPAERTYSEETCFDDYLERNPELKDLNPVDLADDELSEIVFAMVTEQYTEEAIAFTRKVFDRVEKFQDIRVLFNNSDVIKLGGVFARYLQPVDQAMESSPFGVRLSFNPRFVRKDGQDVLIPLGDAPGGGAMVAFAYDEAKDMVDLYCNEEFYVYVRNLTDGGEYLDTNEMNIVLHAIADNYIGYLYHLETGKPSRYQPGMSESEARNLRRHGEFPSYDGTTLSINMSMSAYGKIRASIKEGEDYDYEIIIIIIETH